MKQMSFSDLEYQSKKRTTRKQRFLGEMDNVLPWKLILKPIAHTTRKQAMVAGPLPLKNMSRIYFMQQWYQLSDPAMEDSL